MELITFKLYNMPLLPLLLQMYQSVVLRDKKKNGHIYVLLHLQRKKRHLISDIFRLNTINWYLFVLLFR